MNASSASGLCPKRSVRVVDGAVVIVAELLATPLRSGPRRAGRGPVEGLAPQERTQGFQPLAVQRRDHERARELDAQAGSCLGLAEPVALVENQCRGPRPVEDLLQHV